MSDNIFHFVMVTAEILAALVALIRYPTTAAWMRRHLKESVAGVLVLGVTANLLTAGILHLVNSRVSGPTLAERGVLVTASKKYPDRYNVAVKEPGFGDEDIPELHLIGTVVFIEFNQYKGVGEGDIVTSKGIPSLPWDNLQFLALRGPSFDDDAAIAIREYSGGSLRSLNLTNSRITDMGIHELAGSEKLTKLWRLQLVNCTGVTDAAVDDLIRILTSHADGNSPNVEEYEGNPSIDLTNTKVSPEARHRLAEALPGVEIIPVE